MAENNKIISGLIVGDDTKRRGVYRVLLFNNEGGNWKFSKQEATEKQLIDALNKRIVKLLNAKNEFGRIVGTTGSLDRFVNNVNHPLVIIAELIDDKNNVLGYKVADYNGEVKNVKLQQLLDYCKVITKKGGIPIQNGIYTPDSKDKKAYIRSYDTNTFLTEVITRQNTQYNNNNNNNQHKVDTVKNEAVISIEDIFEGRAIAYTDIKDSQVKNLTMQQLVKGIKDEIIKGRTHSKNINFGSQLEKVYNVNTLRRLGNACSWLIELGKKRLDYAIETFKELGIKMPEFASIVTLDGFDKYSPKFTDFAIKNLNKAGGK